MSVSLTAQFSGGEGSDDNPYIIKTAADLVLLGTLVEEANDNFNNKCYKLGNDISLAAYQGGTGWKPIGYVGWFIDYAFHGVFDGDNKKITGLVINNINRTYAGLFGAVTNGTVKNLTVENVKIRAEYDIGGVAGYLENTTISNCHTSGEISGDDLMGYGGVVGSAYGSYILDCHSTCKINGTSSVGGVAGNLSNSSTMKNCYSTGEISGSGSVGGVVGSFNGKLSYCYSTGNVTGGGNEIGGIVGSLDGGSVSNCYSTGDVIGYNVVGGVAGYVSNTGSVSNCYSTGKIIGNPDRVGGIAGYVDWEYVSGTVSNCVALNPSVNATGTYVGRVAGLNDWGILSNNAAYEGMETIFGNTVWFHIGANREDGVNMSKQTIQTDGTLGYRFMSAYGWTTQNGKLPGLFGNTVDLPAHLRGGVGVEELKVENGEWKIYPNPTTRELRIENGELKIENVEIFDVYGRKIFNFQLSIFNSIDVSHLSAGVYFVKIHTAEGEVTQKVIKE